MVNMHRTAQRPVPCMHKCSKTPPSTLFVRFHPFKSGWEVRRCPGCGRDSAYDCRSVAGERPKNSAA